MADYTTHDEGVGATGLVVAAVLIGLFILVLAMLGTGTIPASQATNPSALVEEPAVAVPSAGAETTGQTGN